jgi:hypothetical protein
MRLLVGDRVSGPVNEGAVHRDGATVWEKDMRSVKFVLVVLMSGSIALAGEAVSEMNGKLGYAGGSMDGDGGNNVFGSFSLPLAPNFGLQADGLYTNVSDRDFSGAGGHLFWRDWDKGLLGVMGGAVHESNIDASLAGLEGEYYWDRFTLFAGAGVATIDYDHPAPFIDTDVTDFFGDVGLRYYPLDDLMLAASYVHVFDNELFLGSVEYQIPIKGVSLFAEFARGENDYDHALFGLQIYFGPSKPLIRRHREDDPPNVVRQVLDGIGLYGAEFNKRAADYAESVGDDSGGDGYGLFLIGYYGGFEEWAVRTSAPGLDTP